MFSDPQQIVNQLGLVSGMSIADIGTGSGEYIAPLARAVGSEGKVYAVDVQKDLLERVKNRADEEGLTNVEVVWANAEKQGGVKIRDNAVSAVFLANVFFQIEDREGMFQEIRRILKSDGRVFLVDWKESFGGLGPSDGELISENDAEKMFTEHQFTRVGSIQAGEYHYGIMFEKSV